MIDARPEWPWHTPAKPASSERRKNPQTERPAAKEIKDQKAKSKTTNQKLKSQMVCTAYSTTTKVNGEWRNLNDESMTNEEIRIRSAWGKGRPTYLIKSEALNSKSETISKSKIQRFKNLSLLSPAWRRGLDMLARNDNRSVWVINHQGTETLR